MGGSSIPSASLLNPSGIDQGGKMSFRAGHRDVVEAVLEGRDLLAVMPTGSGKSLGFQLP